MNYKKIYNNLVSSRKYRGKKRKGDGYHNHHIIPKSIGGTNDPDNFVLLTFKEHLLAHKLLCEIYPESNQLKYAYLRMIQFSHSNKIEDSYKIVNGVKLKYTTSDLESLKNSAIEFLRESNLGRHLSEETKEKLRISHLGKKASSETKKLLSKIRKGHKVSEETRRKISEARKGMHFLKSIKSICPNQEEGGNYQNMQDWLSLELIQKSQNL